MPTILEDTEARARAEYYALLGELAEVMEDRNSQEWRAQAACVGTTGHAPSPTLTQEHDFTGAGCSAPGHGTPPPDENLFYPEKGYAGRRTADAAQAICATCPVRTPCGEYAVARKENYGIWGQMTPIDLRSARKDPAAA